MHESGLMAALVRKIVTLATEQGATSVCRIDLEVGSTDDAAVAHLLDHFKVAAQGTLCEVAKLNIKRSGSSIELDPTALLLRGVEFEFSQ